MAPRYGVFLTRDALGDLDDIHDYIQRQDGLVRARQVLARIEQQVGRLSSAPHRGVLPAELRDTGIRDFREVFFKPYRIIYRVQDSRVYVLLVADGRRDMRSLLLRRLLDGG